MSLHELETFAHFIFFKYIGCIIFLTVNVFVYKIIIICDCLKLCFGYNKNHSHLFLGLLLCNGLVSSKGILEIDFFLNIKDRSYSDRPYSVTMCSK